jgi:hypothetical protein
VLEFPLLDLERSHIGSRIYEVELPAGQATWEGPENARRGTKEFN